MQEGFNLKPVLSREILLEIIQTGAHAISAYNCQPWRFALREDGIDVFLIRTKNFFLKLEGISYMELGAVVENLAEGAAAHGFETSMEILSPVLGPDAPSVALKFQPRTGPVHNIRHVIDRHTHRGFYAEQPLSNDIQRDLTSLGDDPNVEIIFKSGEEKAFLAKILAELEGIRYANYYLMREVVYYLRFGAVENQNARDYIDVKTLGFSNGVIAVLHLWDRLLKSRIFYWISIALGFHKQLIAKYHDLLKKTGSLLCFAIQERDYRSFIRLGRIIQRVLNELSKNGFAAMPILSGLYLFDVLQENEEIFSKTQIRRLRQLKHNFDDLFLPSGKKIAFILRAGKADNLAVRSLRKPISYFIIDRSAK